MKYCKKCLMPDTRPGLRFNSDGICFACLHYEKQKQTDWNKRWKELELLCDKYRGTNGDGPDCAIAVSGGKDSHYQVYLMKEKLNMNPILFSVENIDWTKTGKENLENLSDTFACDMISFKPNRKIARLMSKKSLEEIGSSSWYIDALIYSFPVRMSMKLGIKLLVYGEDVNYTYGGEYSEETSSAKLQAKNDVVKPVWEKWFKDRLVEPKDLESTRQPNLDEIEKSELEPIYLSYFVPWNSHHNFKVAQKWGFKHLGHEHIREGSIDNYDQIDSLSYMLNPFLKYLKYGHSVATDNASRWIRYGLKSRNEMIPIVEELDGKLDQKMLENFCEFTQITVHDFWNIVDKWYNTDLFEKDNDGLWHPKFKVGSGLTK